MNVGDRVQKLHSLPGAKNIADRFDDVVGRPRREGREGEREIGREGKCEDRREGQTAMSQNTCLT